MSGEAFGGFVAPGAPPSEGALTGLSLLVPTSSPSSLQDKAVGYPLAGRTAVARSNPLQLYCAGQNLGAPLECNEYEPWLGFYQECTFGINGRQAYTQITGVADLKLFRTPDGGAVKGIFGRKPPAIPGHPFCSGPEKFQLWLADMPKPGVEATVGQLPLPLRFVRRQQQLSVEKNWMPFHYKGSLFAVRYVQPHQVGRN